MALGKVIELDDQIRKLYSKYDFKYFLDRHLRQHQYTEEQINALNTAHSLTVQELKASIRKNKRQSLYVIDGMIRKSHSGGFLPALFNLDDSRGSGGFIDFDGIGETWAYFEIWAGAERRKIFKREFWDIAVKTGAILGVVLTVVKIIEVLQA